MKQMPLPLDSSSKGREQLLVENAQLRKLLADAYAEIRSYDQKLFRAHAARNKAERRAV